MRFDLYRRNDGVLIAVPSRLGPSVLEVLLPARFVRSVTIDLGLLSDEFVAELGLHGHAVAMRADAALLRSASEQRIASGGVE